jgi:hypothetical protein
MPFLAHRSPRQPEQDRRDVVDVNEDRLFAGVRRADVSLVRQPKKVDPLPSLLACSERQRERGNQSCIVGPKFLWRAA